MLPETEINSIDLNDIKAAKKRIHGHINDTPIYSSFLLNKWLGHEIYFKVEALQKIGAFKARGACNTVSWLVENNNRPDRILAHSSGNHAQAVAWASKTFGIPSIIFIPSSSSKVKIQATESYGAEVVLCESRIEAEEKVEERAKEAGNYWIPPFDHQQVIAGQGTAVYDAIHQMGKVDAVFAPCGGGGLLSGSLVAARELSSGAQVIGSEPLNANDAALSLRNNAIHRLASPPNTLADGARTMAISDITFSYLKKLDDFYEIEETSMVYWTQWLTHLLKLNIEPTSALPMAAVQRWLTKQTGRKKVLIVLSGGNIDQNTHTKIWQKDWLTARPSLESIV